MAETVVEKGLALGDGVVLGGLEVREAIVAQEVDCVHDGCVLRQFPGGPGIDMSDLDIGERSTLQSRADLLDVLNNLCRCRANASIVGHALRAAPVQVLRANADADDTSLQLLWPSSNSLLQRTDLLVDRILTSRCPDAEEKVRLGIDGGFDGYDETISLDARWGWSVTGDAHLQLVRSVIHIGS